MTSKNFWHHESKNREHNQTSTWHRDVKLTNMKYLLLFLIPAALLVNISYNNKTEFGQDPNYIYLFNALNLASHSGSVNTYVNPGTTVVELSAVIVKISFLFRTTNDDISTDVLKNPQYYIKIIVRTFDVMNSLLIFLLGLFILRMTHELTYSLLFQSIPIFSGSAIEWCFQSLCPEPVIFGAVIAFVILFLWKFYFNKNFGEVSIKYFKNLEIRIDKFIILFGILMGFCLVTKINTIPLIILPLLFIPGFKNKFIFLIIAIVSFFVFSLPIHHLYRIMISWYLRAISHTDLYGGGNAGFIDPGLLRTNFLVTMKFDPIILFVIMISLLIVILQIIRRRNDIHLKILAALVLVQLIDLLMVLKHFNLHYFIPIVPTLAVNVFIILQIFNASRVIKFGLIVPFLAASFYLNKNIEKYVPHLYDSNYPSDGINVFSYKCKSPIYALEFGDAESNYAYSAKLKNLYGNYFFYNITTKQFTTWDSNTTLDSLFRMNSKVYLHALDYYMKELPPPFGIRFISEGLYLIENTKRDSLKVK